MAHARHHGQGNLESAAPGDSAAGGQTDQNQKEMTSFDEVYNQPDPRHFFRQLGRWDYQTPHHAQ
ncbi:hypothetical protein ACF073_23880 [Streptomyces sp. NPDC015171]|uniref:hypothetical protein n=1 Tax=Streptomyces sp. NPDC015171 TaxID=3364945 RepID=UPI0036FA41D5